jgi:hypothetical protein
MGWADGGREADQAAATPKPAKTKLKKKASVVPASAPPAARPAAETEDTAVDPDALISALARALNVDV